MTTSSPPSFSRTQIINLAGIPITCHRHGKDGAPVVICLHATGHGARDFLKLAHSLESSHEFIAIDFPGQGDSPRETTPASAERYAEILKGVVNELGLNNYTVLGNSIGGAAAFVHAAAYPDQIRALILCNPGGLQPVNLIARLYCGYMAKFFAKGEQGDGSFPTKFRTYYEKKILPGRDAAWRREEIIAAGVKSAPILQEAWKSFARPEADLRDIPAQLPMPILYAWCRSDQAVAWSRSKRAALTAPHNEAKFFKGGHCAFLEDPKEFRNALLAFERRNTPVTKTT